jgi:nucleotide-binding universal stress UspA family protein
MALGPTAAFLAGTRPPHSGSTHISGQFDGDGILVPLLTPDIPTVIDQLRVAASFGRTIDASLHVIDPVTAAKRDSAELRHEFTTDDEGELLDWARAHLSQSGSGTNGRLQYTRNLVRGISRTAEANDIDTLVMPSGSQTGVLRREVTERLALRADCNVITVNGRPGYDHVPSILLPVAGGPHSDLATDVAQRIAADFDAWVDILHVVNEEAPERVREQAQTHVEAAAERIARPELTSTWILEAPDIAEAIIEQSTYYELTVVGAPTKGRLRRFIAGSTNRTIRNNAHSVVLSARKNC